jgi:hypothetical protein
MELQPLILCNTKAFLSEIDLLKHHFYAATVRRIEAAPSAEHAPIRAACRDHIIVSPVRPQAVHPERVLQLFSTERVVS